MRTILLILACQFGRIVCVVAAAILAYHGIAWWGWFLAVGLFVGYSFDNDNK